MLGARVLARVRSIRTAHPRARVPHGWCAKRPAVGDRCPCATNNLSEWDTPLRCDATTNLCVLGEGEGAACEPMSSTCQYGLSCVEGHCGIPRPFAIATGLGESCDRLGDRNYPPPRLCRGGAWCNAEHVCVPPLKLGERCLLGDGAQLACGWDAVCLFISGTGSVCTAISELCG